MILGFVEVRAVKDVKIKFLNLEIETGTEPKLKQLL